MLLLAPDAVVLRDGAAVDGHGWAEQPAAEVWAGVGNLQETATDPGLDAAAGGGHGRFDPEPRRTATLFLDPGVPVAAGQVAEVGGQLWAVGPVQQVADPAGTGIACQRATVRLVVP